MKKANVTCSCSDKNLPRHEVSCPQRYMTSPPAEIARIVQGDWKKVYFGAVPYVEALRDIGFWGDKYIAETCEDVVIGFLSNASGWRGPVAKAVKAVLNYRLENRLALETIVAP